MKPVTIHLPRPTNRRGLTTVTLTPGVVDEDAEEVFSFGYCYLLALAMHEATGWRIAVLDRLEPDGSWRGVHVAVVTPDDWFVDIRGRRYMSGALNGDAHLRVEGANGKFHDARLRTASGFLGFGQLIEQDLGVATLAEYWLTWEPSFVRLVRGFAEALLHSHERSSAA